VGERSTQGLEYRAFVEGEEITRAPRRFYIVRDGKVDVRKLTEPQGPTLKTITSGDFFGDREMLSGFVDRVRTAIHIHRARWTLRVCGVFIRMGGSFSC
jgi:CRP-like cAMP-binding protein